MFEIVGSTFYATLSSSEPNVSIQNNDVVKFDIENIHSNENYDVNSGMFTCYTHGTVLPSKFSSLKLTNFSQSRSIFQEFIVSLLPSTR